MSGDFGAVLPAIQTPPPGPESRRLAGVLGRYESPNVTFVSDTFPIFWSHARGANVRDVDGNVYVDLTGGFAVANAGHGHPAIVAAVVDQAERLLHGMGDVHPPAVKAEVLEVLAEVTPAGLTRSILTSSGAEAVEAALKTVLVATGRPRVLAFEGSYHGLTLGSLAASGRQYFRRPFARQLADLAIFAPFPAAGRGGAGEDTAAEALEHVEERLDVADASDVGAILVEPIQGRGGDVVPPADWLPGLRRICDERGLLLVLDEVYTGFGRTGRWFACEHWGVVPDLLVVGKGLTGGLPFAACVGSDTVMGAWPASTGEALHTSTFLGHPLGCAAALAAIAVLRTERLVERAAAEGAYTKQRLERDLGAHPSVSQIRGLGLMIGVELVGERGDPDPQLAGKIVLQALRRGFLVLAGGVSSNVLSLSPPLMVGRDQMNAFLDMLGEVLWTGK